MTLREAANAYEAGRGAGAVDIASQEAPLKSKIAKILKAEQKLVRLVAYDDSQTDTIEAELRQLGKDGRRLAEQLQAVQETIARYATVERPRDIEALCAQARRGLANLDERGKWDLLRDVVDEIKVGPDKTLTMWASLAGRRTCHQATCPR